jgi:hypothetical protein
MMPACCANDDECETPLVDWVAGLDGGGEGFEDGLGGLEALAGWGEEVLARCENAVVCDEVLWKLLAGVQRHEFRESK